MKKMYLENVKNFFLKKKKFAILGLIAVAVFSYFIFRSPKSDIVSVEEVKFVDLFKSVRATGQVVSNTNLDLSFNKSGIVKSVKVLVGDEVKKGQVLATLDQGQALAALTQARGTLLGAQAKHNKIIAGASDEELFLAEVNLKNAQNDLENTINNQKILVANAYQNLLNSSLEVFPTSVLASNQSMPTLSGTYVLGKEGDITISISQSGQDSYFSTSGLIRSSGVVSSTTAQQIGDSGLYIKFPINYSAQGDLIIPIPNKKATNYLTNFNAYKSTLETETSAISSAQSSVYQKQAELNLKKATARSTDIDIAQADIISAQGSLESAEASFEDTIIRAPEDGTITKVNIKYGELSEVGKPSITLEDIGNLYIEALINEANIVYLKIGQSANITFDAFGSSKEFTGVIANIDPSSQSNDGVVNYKIKVSLTGKDDTIRSGMNANVNILAGEMKNVLALPNIFIIKKDNKNFVNIITDIDNKKYTEREVVTGFLADNNLVEIISGLSGGDKVAYIAN